MDASIETWSQQNLGGRPHQLVQKAKANRFTNTIMNHTRWKTRYPEFKYTQIPRHHVDRYEKVLQIVKAQDQPDVPYIGSEQVMMRILLGRISGSDLKISSLATVAFTNQGRNGVNSRNSRNFSFSASTSAFEF